MRSQGDAFVHDVRLAAATAFADLRERVDGEDGRSREVTLRLDSPDSCREWLQKLVSKPQALVRQPRLSGPQRVATTRGSADIASVEPCAVLTWNVCQKHRPTSAQAPADSRLWSSSDNFEAVQAEVLRLQPDVLTLQECAGEAAASRLAQVYDFLGARGPRRPRPCRLRAPLREEEPPCFTCGVVWLAWCGLSRHASSCDGRRCRFAPSRRPSRGFEAPGAIERGGSVRRCGFQNCPGGW